MLPMDLLKEYIQKNPCFQKKIIYLTKFYLIAMILYDEIDIQLYNYMQFLDIHQYLMYINLDVLYPEL